MGLSDWRTSTRRFPVLRAGWALLSLLAISGEWHLSHAAWTNPAVVSSALVSQSRPTTPKTNNPAFKDLRLGVGRITYQDPEFWAPTKRVVWQDQRTGNNWLAGIDTTTGAMVPASGQGFYVGPSKKIVTADAPAAFNGPEFGISRTNGLCLYYTLEDSKGFNQVYRFSLVNGQYAYITACCGIDRSGALPSSDPNAPFCGVTTFNFVGSNIWNPGFRYENQPTTDVDIPIALRGTSGPRWVPGRMTLVTNQRDANRSIQIALWNPATRALTFATTGGTNIERSEGEAFFPPEYPGKLGIWCLEKEGSTQRLVCYVETTPGQPFARVKELPAPVFNGDSINMYSLEAVTFNGKSYVAFAGSALNTLPWLSETEIFLAGLDQTEPVIVTDFRDGNSCIDPEVVVMDGKFFLYYVVQRVLWVNEMHVLTDFTPVPAAPPAAAAAVTP
jgi:hypothetical protein